MRALFATLLLASCSALAAQQPPPPPPPPLPLPDEAIWVESAYVTFDGKDYTIHAEFRGWGVVDLPNTYVTVSEAQASDNSAWISLHNGVLDYYQWPTPYRGGEVYGGYLSRTVKGDGSSHLGNRIKTDGGCYVTGFLYRKVFDPNGFALQYAKECYSWAPLIP